MAFIVTESCIKCKHTNCVEVCPVGNEPMLDILRARQDLVMMESKFPQEAMETFDKIEIGFSFIKKYERLNK